MKYLPEFSKLKDQELKKLLKQHNIGLTVSEARKIAKVLGRTPTLTEAILWGIQGSEHCSYKSSGKYLKTLPVKAPNVIRMSVMIIFLSNQPNCPGLTGVAKKFRLKIHASGVRCLVDVLIKRI